MKAVNLVLSDVRGTILQALKFAVEEIELAYPDFCGVLVRVASLIFMASAAIMVSPSTLGEESAGDDVEPQYRQRDEQRSGPGEHFPISRRDHRELKYHTGRLAIGALRLAFQTGY